MIVLEPVWSAKRVQNANSKIRCRIHRDGRGTTTAVWGAKGKNKVAAAYVPQFYGRGYYVPATDDNLLKIALLKQEDDDAREEALNN
jgi:hypothetical protein